jgi:hypothetical protein
MRVYPIRHTPEILGKMSGTIDVADLLYDGELSELLQKYTESFYNPNDILIYDKFIKAFERFNETHKDNIEMLNESLFCEAQISENIALDNKPRFVEFDKELKDTFKDKIPIYILFNSADHMISKLITFFTRGDFSHASLATGMDKIHSFGMTTRGDGVEINNILEFLSLKNPRYFKVIAIPVDRHTYIKMRIILKHFEDSVRKFKYSRKKLFMFPFTPSRKYGSVHNSEFICTEFVMYTLNVAGFNSKDISVKISPSGLSSKLDKNHTTLYNGSGYDFPLSYIQSFENHICYNRKKMDLEVDNIISRIKTQSELSGSRVLSIFLK